MPELVREGRLALTDVDRAAGNVIRAKFAAVSTQGIHRCLCDEKMGTLTTDCVCLQRLFDEGMYVDESAVAGLLDQPAHRALALEVASQGITLLRNGALSRTSPTSCEALLCLIFGQSWHAQRTGHCLCAASAQVEA